MSATPHDSTGTTLTFAGNTYTVTNIVQTFGGGGGGGAENNDIDISHLGLTAGSSVKALSRPLRGTVGGGGSTSGRSVQIDYLGLVALADGTTGTLSITSGGVSLVSSAATVESSTLTLAVNDVIRGQATFTVAR